MSTRLALAALSIYCAFLITAAWPVTATGIILTATVNKAGEILNFFAVEPGLTLFYRRYDEVWKIRRHCFHFRLFSRDNSLLKAENIGEGCEANRSYKWQADPLTMVLYRLFEEPGMERIDQAMEHGDAAMASEEFRGPREASLYSVVGEYLCHSPKFKDLPTARVVMGWWRTEINYQNNETRERYFVAMQWNCAQHSIDSQYYTDIPAEMLNDLARK